MECERSRDDRKFYAHKRNVIVNFSINVTDASCKCKNTTYNKIQYNDTRLSLPRGKSFCSKCRVSILAHAPRMHFIILIIYI